jgi:hypothetical protein
MKIPRYPKHKLSKTAVDYGKGMPKTHCGNCAHFQPPRSCAIVAGVIRSQDWCRRFVKK